MIRQPARVLLAGIAWLFVAGVVVQVFLAGVGLFGVGSLDAHRGFGYALPYVTFLMLLVAIAARPDRRTGWLIVGLVLLGGVVQPILPYFKAIGYPVVAALHPPNALLVFWLGLVLARRATNLARRRDSSASEPPA